MDINKYWIGYITGWLIFFNFFSAGIILGNILNLNLNFFLIVYLVSLSILLPIRYLIKKQLRNKRELNENI